MRPDRSFLISVLVVAISGLLPTMAQAQSFDIDAASWQQPRSGYRVQSLPAVQSAVRVLLSAPESALIIHHQEDEEGALWGAELHDWLLSLGIAASRMTTQVGDISPAALRLEVKRPASLAP